MPLASPQAQRTFPVAWGTVFRDSWVVRMMVGRFMTTSVRLPDSRQVWKPSAWLNTSMPTRP